MAAKRNNRATAQRRTTAQTHDGAGAQAHDEGAEMNKRIKELAEQAGYESDMFGIGHWDMPEFKKFAELIIRECADIAQFHVMNVSTYADAEFVDNQIKEHFGVTE